MTEDIKVEQVSSEVMAEQMELVNEVIQEEKASETQPTKTIKKPNVFRSVQYGQHFFWIHNGQAGVCCSRKIDGIKELQKQFPGEYTVEDVMPYTPRKYSDKIPTEISKK
jgi:hypothetical protein